jgi:hypothetical protein
MAAASKFSANERLVRKRLAARLRQRRCRERKREAAALTVKKVDVQVETSPSTGESSRLETQKPVLLQEHVVARDADHCPSSRPRPTGTSWNEPMKGPATQAMVSKHPSPLLESATASPRCDYGPVPVSPGNSTAEAEGLVKNALPTNNKPLASQEMAAIDAMLALRSNDASSADEAEEETGSTSSLSSKDGGRSSQITISKRRMKVPDTVYHHHHPYRPAPPPPTLAYYHYQHPHAAAPPLPWGPHYLPHHPHPHHHHPYHPLPPPQPAFYWTRPSNGKPPHAPPSSSSATVSSRVRA